MGHLMMIIVINTTPHTPVDSALRQVVDVHTRRGLLGVHDVIQYSDWLI